MLKILDMESINVYSKLPCNRLRLRRVQQTRREAYVMLPCVIGLLCEIDHLPLKIMKKLWIRSQIISIQLVDRQ